MGARMAFKSYCGRGEGVQGPQPRITFTQEEEGGECTDVILALLSRLAPLRRTSWP